MKNLKTAEDLLSQGVMTFEYISRNLLKSNS
jgi:hypothetical protein